MFFRLPSIWSTESISLVYSPWFKCRHIPQAVLRMNFGTCLWSPGTMNVFFVWASWIWRCDTWNHCNHFAIREDSLPGCQDIVKGILGKWSCSLWIKPILNLTYLWNHCFCALINSLFFSQPTWNFLYSQPWAPQLLGPLFQWFPPNIETFEFIYSNPVSIQEHVL